MNLEKKQKLDSFKLNNKLGMNEIECKICETCNILKTPRVFHCNICNCCISVHDHHCPWVGSCIG